MGISLVDQNALFRDVFLSAPDAVLIINGQGEIQMVNARCLEMFGYSETELKGEKVEKLMPKRFHACHSTHRSKYNENPHPRAMGPDLELFGQRKNGQEFRVEISLSPLKVSGEQYVSAAIRDMTAQHYQAEALKARSKEVENLIYVATHDLQEPLNNIIQALGVLSEVLPQGNKEELEHYCDLAVRSTKHLSDLIHDILEYARLGHNTQPTSVNLQEVYEEVLEKLDSLIKKNEAKITLVEKLPIVKGYKIELASLFYNLIANAIKYRHKDRTPEISIFKEETDSHYLFAVKDNGIGIDEKYKEKVFEMFTRLHKKTLFPGNGIGLSHCKKIAELHHGKIWVESEPEKGSVFYVTIGKFL